VAKNQYNLCIDVLRRLESAGILQHIVLVGSWCTLFYKEYFEGTSYAPLLKTRDIDLLIPEPSRIKTKVDIADLLKEMGFVVGFTGSQGYIRLEHPELIVEFLVPEKGKSTDKPYPLPQLGVNAQALRFLDFLSERTITVHIQGMTITLPHPVHFALQKLIILQRRADRAKSSKDEEAAQRILHSLIRKGEKKLVRDMFNAMPPRWQKLVRKAVSKLNDPEVANVFA
jgi:hypothetical protein